MDLGINLWGSDILENGQYLFPTGSQIDYFAAKGFSNIRLTFGWETIQSKLDGPLDAGFVSQIREVVEYAASQGVDVILDVHNYGKFEGSLIGSPEVPVSSFADLWGKIATEFVNNDNVRFGLMNEPQQGKAADWLSIANSAIAAIRDAGADQQVLVPGIGWTGAWSWAGGSNAAVIGAPGAIVDPANNYAFEVHQYLDDTSGQHEWVVSENIGVERLTSVTEWARANGVPLYLGEFGVADNPQALAALDKMMDYLTANSDVWKSASYWVAGTANPTYIYTAQPDLKILDVPQMDVLEKYTGAKYTETKLADGTIQQDVYAHEGKVITLSDVLTADGRLISRSIFDADGDLSSKAVVAADGRITVTVFGEAGKSHPVTETIYNAGHERVAESVTDADGALVTKLYEPGAHDPYQEAVYHADGSLDHISKHIKDQHIGETYTNGVLAKIEVYNSSWALVSRDSFDASGKLMARQVDNADGSHDVSTFNTKTGLTASSTEYSSAWKITGTTSYDSAGHPTRQVTYETDGGRTIVSYATGSDTLARSEHLTADGKLASLTTYSESGQITNVYATPGSSQLQSTVVVEHGEIVSTAKYDAKGLISSIERIDADGGRVLESYDATHQTHPASITAYDASWKLLEVTYFDEKGHVTVINTAGEPGINTLTSFVSGTDRVSQVEVYLDWKLQTRTKYDAEGKVTTIDKDFSNGTHEVQTYATDHQDHPASTSFYNAAWKLVSITYFDDHGQKTAVNIAGDHGVNTVTGFLPGTDSVSKVEVFVDWKLQSRTTYDDHGKISSVQKDYSDGKHEVQNFTPDHQDEPASTSVYDAAWKLVAYTSFEKEHAQTHALVEDSGDIDLGFFFADSSAHASNFVSLTSNFDAVSHANTDTFDFPDVHISDDNFYRISETTDYASTSISDSDIFESIHDVLVVIPQYDLF